MNDGDTIKVIAGIVATAYPAVAKLWERQQKRKQRERDSDPDAKIERALRRLKEIDEIVEIPDHVEMPESLAGSRARVGADGVVGVLTAVVGRLLVAGVAAPTADEMAPADAAEAPKAQKTASPASRARTLAWRAHNAGTQRRFDRLASLRCAAAGAIRSYLSLS